MAVKYRACKKCGKKGVYKKYVKVDGKKVHATDRCKFCGRTGPWGI